MHLFIKYDLLNRCTSTFYFAKTLFPLSFIQHFRLVKRATTRGYFNVGLRLYSRYQMNISTVQQNVTDTVRDLVTSGLPFISHTIDIDTDTLNFTEGMNKW